MASKPKDKPETKLTVDEHSSILDTNEKLVLEYRWRNSYTCDVSLI
jgi:hypothetical protein